MKLTTISSSEGVISPAIWQVQPALGEESRSPCSYAINWVHQQRTLLYHRMACLSCLTTCVFSCLTSYLRIYLLLYVCIYLSIIIYCFYTFTGMSLVIAIFRTTQQPLEELLAQCRSTVRWDVLPYTCLLYSSPRLPYMYLLPTITTVHFDICMSAIITCVSLL